MANIFRSFQYLKERFADRQLSTLLEPRGEAPHFATLAGTTRNSLKNAVAISTEDVRSAGL
jgi:hypothetical protein